MPQSLDSDVDIPSKAAIAGHPIHPMLVPLPIGFLVGAWIGDIVFSATKNPFWATAALWLLVGGLISGLLAAVVGMVDFAAIRQAREHGAGRIHAVGNVIALALAGTNVWLRWDDPAAFVVPWGLVWSSCITVLLAVTGWFGGELSYRRRIGVFSRR